MHAPDEEQQMRMADEQDRAPKRPDLPDAPMFCEGPVHVDKYASYIWGRDQFGADCMIVQVRGWGYLTGQGQALALDVAEAREAQIKTMKFIADAINEKLKRDAAT